LRFDGFLNRALVDFLGFRALTLHMLFRLGRLRLCGLLFWLFLRLFVCLTIALGVYSTPSTASLARPLTGAGRFCALFSRCCRTAFTFSSGGCWTLRRWLFRICGLERTAFCRGPLCRGRNLTFCRFSSRGLKSLPLRGHCHTHHTLTGRLKKACGIYFQLCLDRCFFFLLSTGIAPSTTTGTSFLYNACGDTVWVGIKDGCSGLSHDHGVSYTICLLFVGVTGLADATLELHATSLLDDVGRLVSGELEILGLLKRNTVSLSVRACPQSLIGLLRGASNLHPHI
jgi:hypothetical protein